MPIVEAEQPNGERYPVYEVDLTKSGLLIQIVEADGRGMLIDRFAWEGIKKAVDVEFARATAEARQQAAAEYDPTD